MNPITQAIVLQVGKRYYSSHTQKKIVTAWSLAGAKMFLDNPIQKLLDIEELLTKKGYKPTRKLIQVVEI